LQQNKKKKYLRKTLQQRSGRALAGGLGQRGAAGLAAFWLAGTK